MAWVDNRQDFFQYNNVVKQICSHPKNPVEFAHSLHQDVNY